MSDLAPEMGPVDAQANPAPGVATSLHLIAASKIPSIDAKTAVALAHTGDPGQVLEHAQATAEYATHATAAATLATMPAEVQQKNWEDLGKSPDGQDTQAKLTAAAYRVPTGPLGVMGPVAAQPAPGGIGHDLLGVLDNVRHIAASVAAPVGRGVAAQGKSALHILSTPFNALTHVYRMEDLLANEAEPGAHAHSAASMSEITDNLNMHMWAHSLDPGNWAQAWRETANGQTTYDPETVRVLKQQFGNGVYSLIEQISNGQDPAKLAGGYSTQIDPSTGYSPQQTAIAFMNTTEFQDGLRQLAASRYSPGQDIVGSTALAQGGDMGKIAHLESGAMDGIFDWYADPLVLGSKVMQAQKLARFGLDANDVMTLYRGDTQVGAAMDDIAKTVNRGKAAALIERWPKLSPIADRLVGLQSAKGGELTGLDVAHYFSSEQGKIAILSGRAGLFYHGQDLAPHMSVLRKAVLDGQVNLRKSINWASEDSMQNIVSHFAPGYGRQAARLVAAIPQGAGSMARRVSTFLAREPVIDFDSPDATETVLRTAKTMLPSARAAELTNAYSTASAFKQQGLQYAVIRGMIDEIATQSGLKTTVPGRQYFQNLLDDLDDSIRTKRFAATPGLDQLPNDTGKGKHAAAVLERELSGRVALPDFREMARLGRYQGAMGEMVGGPGGDFLDYSMRIWRLGILARLGFAFRAGGEELTNAMARLTPGVVLRSLAARTGSAVLGHTYHPLEKLFAPAAERMVESQELRKALAAGVEPENRMHLASQPLRDITDVLTAGWHPGLRSAIKTSEDYIAAVIGTPQRVVRLAGRHIAGEEMNEAWRQLAKHRGLDGAYEQLVSSVHQNGAGWGDDVRDRMTWSHRGITTIPIELRPTSEYRAYASDGSEIRDPRSGVTIFHQIWAKRLGWIRESDLAHPALDAIRQHEGKPWGTVVQMQRRAVYRTLKSPAMAETVRRAERGYVLRDGRRVGVGGTTLDDALKDWADVVSGYVNELVRTPEGKLIRVGNKTLAEHVMNQKLEPNFLSKIEKPQLPDFVVGQEHVPYHQNALDKVLGGAMTTFVGRPMDWLSRQPIFGANYALARRDVTNHLDALISSARNSGDLTVEHLEQMIHDIAHERAVRETIPYIHDVRSRTMFEHATRHFVPFLFAQRQFWARWGKVAMQSPYAFRRAQQVMNGLRVSGFIRKDPTNGQDYFVYPASSGLINAISAPLRALGIDNYIAVPTSFTGEIRYLTPGLTGVTPDAGPVVTMSLEALLTLAPNMTALSSVLDSMTQGSTKTGAAIAEDLPLVSSTLVSRLLQATYGAATGKGEVATSTIQALNYLVAAHEIDPEHMTINDVNKLKSRLQSWTTNLLVLRAFFGFAAPSSPTLNFDGLHLDSKLQSLLAKEPYDKAIADFIRLYPDGTPYTIGQTGSESGAQLPSTNAGLVYLNSHLDFLKSYPSAGPWLIPASSGKGPFSQAAYDEQLQVGLRQERSVPEWYAEVLYGADASTYYDNKQIYENAVNAPDADVTGLQQAWVKWRDGFYKTHPALQQLLPNDATDAGGGGFPGVPTPAQRRETVISEMSQALENPNLPKSSTTTAIKGLMDAWNIYQHGTGDVPGVLDLQGISSEKSALYNLTNQFDAFGKAYVAAHPEAKPFWAGVLEYSEQW